MSAFSWGLSKKSLSLLYKAFFRSFLTYASPGWFSFFSVTNITTLERLERAAIRAFSSCPASSLIGLFLCEETPPPLRVILTRFALSSYKPALRLLPHFRFDQTWSETKTLQVILERFCIHSYAHAFSYFSWRSFFDCSPFPPRNQPSLWSSLFAPLALTLTPLFLTRCGFRSPCLSFTFQPGDLDRCLCSFSVWQKRLWRPWQLHTM